MDQRLRSAPTVMALLVVAALLQGCASAPKPTARGIADQKPMTTLRDEPFAQTERFVDVAAVLAARTAAPPTVRVADGALGDGVTAAQGALVANRAARDVCAGMARHFRFDDADPDLRVELVVTAIRPTSSAAAGASAVLGVFVPGPFRLPAGLGGFAADGVARRGDEAVLLLHWAEGAGAITEDAKVSSIGDAYQLANEFADDLVDGLVDPRGRDGDTRARVDDETRAANEAVCLKRFGRASVAGRGASILLPLSPEAIDAGAPTAADRDDDEADVPADAADPVDPPG